ncbi:hypothetical protein Tco_0422247 [Tanacetum coccineum]
MLEKGLIEFVQRERRFLPGESSWGSARQCTNSDEENVASYLLNGLATLYLLRRLATPYLLRGLATPYLLRRPRRHYYLVIAFGPEVAFVTPTIPVDRSNMEWFCLRNIRS